VAESGASWAPIGRLSSVPLSDLTRNLPTFRPDVQGLRGIAVLAVVLYHAELGTNGGFAGVDVFFVISGFVVARMVLGELAAEGRISLGRFFARRIRRIVPILTVVNLATLGACVWFLDPFGEQQQAAATARWSTFLAANVQMQLDDTYQKLVGNPFRHLWSLAVEEQFYVLFPILVAAVAAAAVRAGSRRILGWLTAAFSVVGVGSFVYCLVLVSDPSRTGWVRWAFFGMPSRMWEFCAGIVLAFALAGISAVPKLAADVIGLLGLAALAWTFVAIGGFEPFPGPVTLVPVLGTVAVIVGGGANGLVRRALSMRPLTWLGDLSYGWYLWHWPAMVFAAIAWPAVDQARMVAGAVSLVVAALTHRYIEQPLRKSGALVGPRAAALLVGSALLVFGGATAVDAGARDGYGLRDGVTTTFYYDDAFFGGQFQLVARNQSIEGACYLERLENPLDDMSIVRDGCSNDVDAAVGELVVVGDSQALAASEGVLEASRRIGVRAVGFGGSACPMLADPPRGRVDRCAPVQERYRDLIEVVDPEVVVIANLFTIQDPASIESPQDDRRITGRSGRAPRTERAQVDSFLASLRVEARRLVSEGRHVVVMLQPPPGAFSDRTLFERAFPDRATPEELGLDALIAQRRLVAERVHAEFGGEPGVSIFDPRWLVCGNPDRCVVSDASEVRYTDVEHLNPRGSLALVDGWREVLEPLYAD
jgi:peptidoglycan/LPS O-acetylase OafA/YrhL